MNNYFNDDEFACKCGCKLMNIDSTFKGMLNVARHFATVPFIINSGTRCEAHNKAVGGKHSSSHLKGLAVDIKCNTSHDRHTILTALRQSGFTRIGIDKDFIHVDMDFVKDQNVTWVYG